MEIIPILKTGKIVGIKGEQEEMNSAISTLIVELAMRSSVTVLDGGNRFGAYQIMRQLRTRTVDLTAISNRIFVRRAFTFYQVLALLEDTSPSKSPTVALDLLASFYDENIPDMEVQRVLDQCLLHIQRLSVYAPIALGVISRRHLTRPFLEDCLRSNCDQFIEMEMPFPVAVQLGMF